MVDDKDRKKKKKDRKVKEVTEPVVEDDGLKVRRRKEVILRDTLYDDGRRGRLRGRGKRPKLRKTEITLPKASKRRIKLPELVTVASLAHKMSVKATEVIRHLLSLGVAASMNEGIEFEAAAVVATEFGFEAEPAEQAESDFLPVTPDTEENLATRPPVVTVMGHVDHGKTSLLDAIRSTHVTDQEAGGITQHIGAHKVKVDKGELVFLDTPGHEAFTAMRARGAQVTDFVVLVVAADDGVMDQTREAINHSRAANVPLIVAVNKMDKPEADKDRVIRELSEFGLIPETWGGDTLFSYVSAKTGAGVPELLDLILLQAEMMELKANPNKQAIGTVVEARLDKGKGPVGTVLIKEGYSETRRSIRHRNPLRQSPSDDRQRRTQCGHGRPCHARGSPRIFRCPRCRRLIHRGGRREDRPTGEPPAPGQAAPNRSSLNRPWLPGRPTGAHAGTGGQGA